MKHYFILLTTSLCFFCFLLTGDAFALTAKEIVEKSENAVRGDSQISESTVTVVTRRWTRAMTVKSWQVRKGRKSFSEITAPKKDAGNRFLLIEQDMKQYIPKLQQTIKISPSMMLQSWMGSDFTNDDIVKESSIIEDYNHSLLGKETIEGVECYKVQLLPKPSAAVVWGKIIYYARVKDVLPVKEEFYDQHDVMKKELVCSNFKVMGGREIPSTYTMRTIKEKDKYTVMQLVSIKFNVDIPQKVFSLQNLERR